MSVSGIGAASYSTTGYEMSRTERNVSEKQFMDALAEKESIDKNDHAEKAFRSVAPNAPEKVKTAWMEAAAEVGIDGMGRKKNGMMGHISQMMVQRLTNQLKGKPNYNDILVNSVQSALQATKKLLFDLENPLEPISQRSLEVQQQIMKEKEFYQAFIDRLEKL